MTLLLEPLDSIGHRKIYLHKISWFSIQKNILCKENESLESIPEIIATVCYREVSTLWILTFGNHFYPIFQKAYPFVNWVTFLSIFFEPQGFSQIRQFNFSFSRICFERCL